MGKIYLYLLAANLAVANAGATDIRREAGDLVVTVDHASGSDIAPLVQFQRTGQWPPAAVTIDAAIVQVEDVFFPAPGRFVIRGALRQGGGRQGAFVVVDASRGEIVDTLWTLDAAVSPDSKLVAYQYLAPNPGVLAALVGYDLSASPEANGRVGSRRGPADRGVVLYPEENRAAQRYWTVQEPDPLNRCVPPTRSIDSPLAWSPDSKRVAFVEHDGEQTRLVVVDVSEGLRSPRAATAPIDRRSLLAPRFSASMPEEYAGAYPSFREIAFSEDAKGVVLKSWGLGPFAERTFTLPAPVVGR